MKNKIKTTIAFLIIAAIICCACSAKSGGKDALDENDNISISENIISDNDLKETSKDNPNTQENVEEVDIGKLEWVDYTFAIPDEGVSGLYKDFLTNNEKAKYISVSADEDFDYYLGDYFIDGSTYDISELIGNVGRWYSETPGNYYVKTVDDDDIVVSRAEYSLIDCGNDGEYELFVQLNIDPVIDGEVVNEDTSYLVVLKDFKGELKTCYCGISAYRNGTYINKCGMVYSHGSGSASSGCEDFGFIDRHGNWHYLFGYEYENNPSIYPFDGFGKYDDIPAVDDWISLAFWFDCAGMRDHEKYYFTYLINNKEEWSDKLIAGESLHYRSEDYEPGNELFDYFENEDLDITPFYEIEKMISKKNKAEGFDTSLLKPGMAESTLFPVTGGEPARCIHLSDVYYPYYDKNVDIYLNVFSDYNIMNLLICDKGKALDTYEIDKYEISHYSLGLKYDEEEFARNITSINEIQICDYNMDGLSDVIVTYSIDGAIKAVLLEGRYDNNLMRPKISECEKESYYLFIDSVLTDRVSEFLNPPTAENIKKYMGFNESGVFDNWQDAFLFCVELEKRKSEDGNVRFNLIFIDDDDIPELVVDNNIYRFCDGGLRHYEFYTGDENYYVPQNNCFITHEIMGERVPTDIYDTIYCMKDHSLTVMHEGQISLISGDENDGKEQYFVDGIESSKEKYDKIFDRSKALACEAGKLSYEEIYELLTSAPEKYDPEDVTYIRLIGMIMYVTVDLPPVTGVRSTVTFRKINPHHGSGSFHDT